MRIIIVTGMPGAGKEELLNVAVGMGMPFIRMGDLVREGYSSSGAASEGLSVGAFASREREKHGMDIWAKRAVERMSGSIFLVDGCRSMDEVRSYKGLSDNVVLVSVHSSPMIRYARLIRRGREDAPRDLSEFDERDKRELSWGLGEAIALSDVMIDNSGTLDEFRVRSGMILERLR